MSIKKCEDILNGQSLAGTEGGKQVTRDSDGGTGGGDFLDSVIKAAGTIDATAASIYNYDCSDHLIEWMYSVCPSLRSVGDTIDNVVGMLNSITTGVKVGDLIQNNSVSQKICDVITTLFGTVNSWLELISKAAFALFDKIDDARQRMQAALQSLTDAVLQCILDVYNMIEQYFSGMLALSLNFDWDSMERFLRNCPCICRFVAFVTGCDTDSEGNSISDDPDQVIRCIRNKLWFIDGLNLATGLSAIMDTYIKKYIVLFFDAISLAIDSIFTLFIAPFRWLIKKFADLLRKKWDVSFMISPLKSSHLDCLLLYTKDVVDGKTVYRMSVLDMMSSMKMWVNCLEYPCPALSERIKNKVKKFNEEMRLTGDYWNRAFECDIYQCCMRADAVGNSPFSLKELGEMWEDLYDRLRACNRRAKNRVDFAKVTYGLNGTGGVAWSTDMMRNTSYNVTPIDGSIGATSGIEEDPVRMAAEFSDSPERENDINVGDYPLTKQEDELIRGIGLSIAAGCNEDSYFTEKWYQYLRFAGYYAISNKTVSELREVRDKSNGLSADFNGGYETNFPAATVREPLEIEPDERGANYWVDSDYDAARVAKIQDIKWDAQRSNESLVGYYARMYASVG
jgi:hypothetical protein